MNPWHSSCLLYNFVNHKRLRAIGIAQQHFDIALSNSAAAQRVKAALAFKVVVVDLAIQRKATHAAGAHADARRNIRSAGR